MGKCRKAVEILNERAKHYNEFLTSNINEFRQLNNNEKRQVIYMFLKENQDYKAYYTTKHKNINFTMLSNLKYEDTI